MVLLQSVLDISDESFSQELDSLGRALGVPTMKRAFELILPYMKKDGQKMSFFITQENCFEMMRFFYSMAVFNYACAVYEEFAIPTDDVEIGQKLHRTYSIERHNIAVAQCLDNTLRLIEKYGLPGSIAQG